MNLSQNQMLENELIQVKMNVSPISTAPFLCLYSSPASSSNAPLKSEIILQIQNIFNMFQDIFRYFSISRAQFLCLYSPACQHCPLKLFFRTNLGYLSLCITGVSKFIPQNKFKIFFSFYHSKKQFSTLFLIFGRIALQRIIIRKIMITVIIQEHLTPAQAEKHVS